MSMWALARYDLRLSDDEFYSLTPRKFEALAKRHRHENECRELLFGILASNINNSGFRTTETPSVPRDYMPTHWARTTTPHPPTTKEPINLTDELRAKIAHNLRGLFPAR